MVHQPDALDSTPPTDCADARLAIVVSRYHRDVTERLLEGAKKVLLAAGIHESSITIARVPGTWEIPLATQQLAKCGKFDAILCLGAVIRGETTHDIYINQQVSDSLGTLSLQFALPILFGILTCQSRQQALDRAGGAVGNKGSECAQAALEMIGLLRELRTGADC